MRVPLLAWAGFAGLLLAPSPAAAAPSHPDGNYPRKWDRAYTNAIRQHTTAPEFINELVDHVPKSRRVPNPRGFLGYVPGHAGKLTYAADVHRYMRALATRSRHVEVLSMGTTEEGREQILVVIADPATLRRLDRFRDTTRKLSDPRTTSDEEAARLIRRGKPMYWLTGGLHSPETGSPEMLMELAYRLSEEDTPLIREIRKNVITMITPVIEVDGRERMVDVIKWWQGHKEVGVPPLVYWGKYVAHDNNRDAMSFSLKLSQNVLSTWLDWKPQVLHDLHESIPFLYISTGTGPYNAWLDPVAVDTWRAMSQNEVSQLTRRGMPGVWNHGFYDGWAPSYMFYIAHGHNGIGRFYETFGNSTPDTRERRVLGRSERAWYRPNPPYPVVQWSLRNNVNYMQSGVLMALSWTARHREELLQTFWDLGRRSVAKARTEGPGAYVIKGHRRGGQVRNLVDTLRIQGIEVHRATAAGKISDPWPPKRPEDPDPNPNPNPDQNKKKDDEPRTVEVVAGDYIIRMDQPYSRLADMLLDTQYYRTDDPRPYDDTGWTLGYTKNVTVRRVVNPVVLDLGMEPLQGELAGDPKGRSAALAGGESVAVVADADIDLYRYLWKYGGSFRVADAPVKVGTRELPRGTILIQNATEATGKAADGLAVEFVALRSGPDVVSHPGQLPRVALLHTWYRTQDEGWYRLALEDLGIPYDYISTQDVAKRPDLGSTYDVILFPPCGCSADSVVHGLPAGPAIPWKKTKLTPNLGRNDSTDDIRPGLGLAGVTNLKAFVAKGGTLITVGDTTRLAIQYGITRHVDVVATNKLRAPGTIVKGEVVDAGSPVSYGYDGTLPLYYSRGPVLRVGRHHKPDEPPKRPTGRGGTKDPDVPQGRVFLDRAEDRELDPADQGWIPIDGDVTARSQTYTPAVKDRPRVVVRYAKKASDLWMSGMLGGGAELAGKAAVVDAPVGKGHVVLFGFNPMWRQQTQGTFGLVLNAMINTAALSTGWPPPRPEKTGLPPPPRTSGM